MVSELSILWILIKNIVILATHEFLLQKKHHYTLSRPELANSYFNPLLIFKNLVLGL